MFFAVRICLRVSIDENNSFAGTGVCLENGRARQLGIDHLPSYF